MKKVVLDGSAIEDVLHLHDLLQELLELPDYYGRNLDALWDCLTGEVALPLMIEWVHYAASRQKLGDAAEQFVELFRDAERELADFHFIIA